MAVAIASRSIIMVPWEILVVQHWTLRSVWKTPILFFLTSNWQLACCSMTQFIASVILITWNEYQWDMFIKWILSLPRYNFYNLHLCNLSEYIPRRPLKLLYCWPIWFSGSDVSVMWWAKLELWIKWLTSLLDWRDLLRRLLRGLLRGLFSSTSILRDMSSTRLRLRASLSPPLRKSISESTWKSEKNALI